MSGGLKTLLILLIVLVFGTIGYFLFFADGSNISLNNTLSSPLQSSSGQPVSGLNNLSQNQDINADQISQEFLSQLLSIRSIRLRDDIFTRPAFVSLVDFTIELVQQGNEGRENPFAPFGADGYSSLLMPGSADIQIFNENQSQMSDETLLNILENS